MATTAAKIKPTKTFKKKLVRDDQFLVNSPLVKKVELGNSKMDGLIFLGLDLSLRNSGVAILKLTPPSPTLLYGCIPSEYRGVYRLQDVRNRICAIVDRHGPIHMAAIEGYAYGAKGNSSYLLAELGGVMRVELWDRQIPFISMPPATLKHFLTGNGKASKHDMMFEVEMRIGAVTEYSDEADAIALAYAAMVHYKRRVDIEDERWGFSYTQFMTADKAILEYYDEVLDSVKYPFIIE